MNINQNNNKILIFTDEFKLRKLPTVLKMSREGPPNRGRGSRGRKRFGDNGFAAWGGYMNAKKTKLEEQFSKEASKECQDVGIFHNIAIFVNGYTGEFYNCLITYRFRCES